MQQFSYLNRGDINDVAFASLEHMFHCLQQRLSDTMWPFKLDLKCLSSSLRLRPTALTSGCRTGQLPHVESIFIRDWAPNLLCKPEHGKNINMERAFQPLARDFREGVDGILLHIRIRQYE